MDVQTRSTPATSLQGAGHTPAVGKPRRRYLLYNRVTDKVLILLVPTVWFAYYSWRPIFQLNAKMPPQFVDRAAMNSPSDQVREYHLAEAYWLKARTEMRPRFAYGVALPGDPPPDFRAGVAGDDGPAPGAPATTPTSRGSGTRSQVARTAEQGSRLRYWRKLQQVWLEPYAWHSERTWSTVWFTRPAEKLCAHLQDYLGNRFKEI